MKDPNRKAVKERLRQSALSSLSQRMQTLKSAKSERSQSSLSKSALMESDLNNTYFNA